ncbi:MAG: hypothetical protein WCJ28_02770 [Actinomycetota bacterium]
MSDSPDEQFQDPQERLAALQAQLASTPASAILANHCYGLFELAAVHLSISPPNFAEARVAIDGLAGLINATEGRLGEDEVNLRDALAQMQLTFVTLSGAAANPTED